MLETSAITKSNSPDESMPSSRSNDDTSQRVTRQYLELEECKWAVNYPEIHKPCYLARVCSHTAPKKCKYLSIEPILQVGPTCGLTALSMLCNGDPTPDQLLEYAKSQSYTRHGEMFSAENLFECAKATINDKFGDSVTVELKSESLSTNSAKQLLRNGAAILIAYDPDYNHGPCLRNGHKAHWALILGFLIDTDDDFYVIARHGKTKNLAIWSLDALSQSNSNLLEFAQPKGYPDLEFLLPLGGISGHLGLLNKYIVIEHLPHKQIVVR